MIRDEQRSGRLTTTRMRENIVRIADILKEDRRSSCRLIAEWIGIPKTIAQLILREDLPKWKLCVWFVPHALIAEQKEQCLNHAYNLIETSKSDPNFLDCIITGDLSWFLRMIWKQSAKVSNSAARIRRPPKNFDFKNKYKDDADFVFYSKGVIHHECVPEGQTLNAMFYIQVLDHLCKHIACVRPEM